MRGNASLILAATAAFFLLRGDARGAQVSIDEQDTSSAPREADTNADAVGVASQEPIIDTGNPMQNLDAFLYAIRCSEHVYPRDTVSDACYNIFYGGARFTDMSDHPANTGERRGVSLPAAVCAASGLGPGCVSTAAGAYQIIRSTWNKIREQSPRLPDFSPASQDEAARRLLAQCGALPLIEMGDFNGALAKASKLWASLPGSKAQQNPKQFAYVADRFAEGLEIYG